MINLLPFLFLLFFTGLLGCTQANLPTAVTGSTGQPPLSSPFPSSTITATPLVQPTFVPSVEPQSTFTATPIDSNEKMLPTKCLDILSTIPEKVELSGHAYLAVIPVPGKKEIGSDAEIDLGTRQLTLRVTSKNTQFGGYKVSPDGKQLAYWKILYSTDKRQMARSIIIEDYDGKILKELPGDLENWNTFYWLDNNRIVIGSYGQPTVLNPFTGEVYGLAKWYAQSPGGLKTIPVWGVNGIFDSQLSRLFYVQEDDTLLLWDLKGKKILAQLNHYSKYWPGDQPQWSWDDQEVVVGYASVGAANMGEELVSVSRDGVISQLTELGKFYSQVAISKFSWSPDGRKIAFFFTDYSKKSNLSQFAILNRETLQVTNYCNLSGSIDPNERPVWSPDGTKVLIGRMEADSTTFKTILLDLSGDYAAVLAENLVPVGWMMAP